MSIATELRAAVLSVIEREGPVTFAAIARDDTVNEIALNKKQITNMVFNLKKFGHIGLNRSGLYYLPKGQLTPNPIPEATPVSEKQINDEVEADEVEADEVEPDMWIADWRVREMLEEQHRVAQDALDAYLTSVGDPKIIEYLRAPRDAARAALEAMVDEGAE